AEVGMATQTSQTGDRRVKCAINGAAKSAGNHYRRAVLFNPPSQMTTHPRLPVRCRAAVAALRSERPDLLRAALDVLTEVHDAKLYVPALTAALVPRRLYPHRGIISEWLGANGTEQLMNAIADHGDVAWGTWLQQMALSDKVPMPVAVATALACDGGLPVWTIKHLITSTSSQSWQFRAVANRGVNCAFADWLAEHYEQCVVTVGNSVWLHLNRVLVACGTDETFERLLARFLKLPSVAQETLCFAVVDRGEPWISRFQKVAFAEGSPQRYHKLLEVVSLEIDDATAWRWIAAGPAELGWQVLIKRHDVAVIPEMLAALPATFANQHLMPALSAMRFIEDAPESLVDELMKRLDSPMQPRAMQDVIRALGGVRPKGIEALISLIISQSLAMPIYFVGQVLTLLRDWERESQQKIRVRTALGDVSFEDWILSARLGQDYNDNLYRRSLAENRNLAVKLVMGPFREDENAIKEIISHMQPFPSYHEELYDLLISSPSLADLTLKVFSGGFDTFPESVLLRTIDTQGIEFHALLRALATASSPSHLTLHKALLTKLLNLPLDLFVYREMAKILRVHTSAALAELLKETMQTMSTNEMWLVREIEVARGELLVDERGEWLA
ncbi:hypothetical protein, partial [Acidiphilium iwatense]